MYLVGVFSGNELLAQGIFDHQSFRVFSPHSCLLPLPPGHGRKITDAENLAARNALLNFFFQENPHFSSELAAKDSAKPAN